MSNVARLRPLALSLLALIPFGLLLPVSPSRATILADLGDSSTKERYGSLRNLC